MRKETKKNIVLALIVSAGLFWMMQLYDTFALPYVFHLRYFHPKSTAFMKGYIGQKELKYDFVPLKKISPYLKHAVILAEDDQFYSHGGFDWEAIKKAAEKNWQRKKIKYGASTITQQLAKNLYLSSSKNPFRKIKELLIALKLERELSKDRILELYLNIVEWGNGIYGAKAAADHYFKINPNSLSKYQAAFLATILPKPKFYDRHRGGPYLDRRISSIQSRL